MPPLREWPDEDQETDDPSLARLFPSWVKLRKAHIQGEELLEPEEKRRRNVHPSRRIFEAGVGPREEIE